MNNSRIVGLRKVAGAQTTPPPMQYQTTAPRPYILRQQYAEFPPIIKPRYEYTRQKMGNRRTLLGQQYNTNMKKYELRCTACGKLLAKGQGEIEIKCTRCKKINTLKTMSFNAELLQDSRRDQIHDHEERAVTSSGTENANGKRF